MGYSVAGPPGGMDARPARLMANSACRVAPDFSTTAGERLGTPSVLWGFLPITSGPLLTDIIKILTILDSGDRVFVHCKEGKDRTGTVVACYRIAADGWGNRKALSEAKSLGMHWYALGMKSYILGFRGL